MSDSQVSESDFSGATREEIMSALFAQMVIQQANMAMMLLGQVPHPQTGETVKDLESARMFIDQLEMLETKTKGNLSKEEENLLRQSLMSLRMAFVEAVNSPREKPTETPPAAAAETTQTPASAAAPANTEAAAGPGSSSAEETKKRFSKKY